MAGALAGSFIDPASSGVIIGNITGLKNSLTKDVKDTLLNEFNKAFKDEDYVGDIRGAITTYIVLSIIIFIVLMVIFLILLCIGVASKTGINPVQACLA